MLRRLFFTALPFLTNAINGLRAKQLNMDLPVSLAILARMARCYATIMSVGEVYFESICMFTFLLLLGKYLEFRARLKPANSQQTYKTTPLTARIIDNTHQESIVAAKKLKLGDVVLIKLVKQSPLTG